ncbi:MAG: DUF5074 domain-containing protein [Chitinophagales bacterium]|nr:DUF5074 domain-containing protein [Chitinophagales bacterium]
MFYIFFSIASCEKEKNTTLPPSGGVYIINEGNFNFGNAEVSVYNPESKQVSNNQFQAVNGYSLGDVAQSMFVKDSFGFIVVNNSSKIEVVKLPSLQKVRTITIPNSSPRYFLAINDSIAYVSELYANKIHVVNYVSGTLVTQISVPQYTEQLVRVDEYVFAEGKKIFANASSKGALIRLRVSDHTFVDKVEFAGDLGGLVKDKNNHLWIAVGSDTTTSTFASLKSFDKHLAQQSNYSFNSYAWHPSNLCISGNGEQLCFLSNDVYRYDTQNGSTPEKVISSSSNNFYALAIDPASDELYVSDVLDYVQPSHVLRYHKNGAFIHSFTAGVIAGNFAFAHE